jgi:hypothetical protein
MPTVPETTNKGGLTKGRSWAQCGHRSTLPTAGMRSGKTLRRPQTSHVNGTPPLCRRDDLRAVVCDLTPVCSGAAAWVGRPLAGRPISRRYCTFHVDMLIIAVLRWIPTVKRIGDPHS